MTETTYKTVQLDNKEYIIIPKTEFVELLEDMGDIKLLDEGELGSSKRYSLNEAYEILAKYEAGQITEDYMDNLL